MAELLRRVDSSEFVEWQVMFTESSMTGDPWRPARDQQYAAWIALHTIVPHQGRNAPRLQLRDFMLYRPSVERVQQSASQDYGEAQRLVAGARAYNAAYSAKKKAKQKLEQMEQRLIAEAQFRKRESI